ncbi:hypothetical protein [Veillonella ratti]|uniref:hypothetical protein n=1 Tax=Veillonella ratti TaxID=103892 RepID=UPI0013DF209B|nr:hypothetical protein [Veillonella ratti]
MKLQFPTATNKTLQLVYPQWQGGANPNYQVGAQVLAALLPTSPNTEKSICAGSR